MPLLSLGLLLALMAGVAVADPGLGVHGRGALASATLVAMAAAWFLFLSLIRRNPYVETANLPIEAAALVVIGCGAATLHALSPDGPGLLGTYFAIASAAARLGARLSLLVAGITLVATNVAEVVAGAGLGLTPLQVALRLAAFSAATAFMFVFLPQASAQAFSAGRRQAEQLLRELRASRVAHAKAAIAQERAHLAREMHDVLAHTLTALTIQLDSTRLLLRSSGPPQALQEVERARELARDGLREARRALHALRSDDGATDAMADGPELLPDLLEDFHRLAGIPYTFKVDGEPRPLPPALRLAVYRIAQEALTNVRKHSSAAVVDVSLRYDPDGVALLVEDRGPTRDAVPAAVAGDGFGLLGMRERAAALGGELRAGPTGTGFLVQLNLPVRARRTA